MSYSEKYDKLNSFCLELWGYLDQFFTEDHRLEFAPRTRPDLGFSARRLTTIRERTALGHKLDERTYGLLGQRTERQEQQRNSYLGIVSSIGNEMKKRLDVISQAGASSEEQREASNDMSDVLDLLSEYGKMGSDPSGWLQRAREVKQRIGDKALSYSKKICSSEDEVWKDRSR